MGKRIDYIDYLKGLSIVWVVWYHTVHPWFVDFSFRIPLFFLASGIFFKIVDVKTYVQKKTNQLLVPLVFFSLVYYLYLILQTYLANGKLSGFDFGVILGIFRPHTGNEFFVVNPPLWFICALICQQIITWALVKTFRKKWLIMTVALIITIIGKIYIWYEPTYFMFGRSLPYLVYYMAGHLYGKQLIGIIESGTKKAYVPWGVATVLFVGAFILKITTTLNETVLIYAETFGLIVMLIYLFKWIHRFRMTFPFWYFGRNSYAVLGLHEIFQTIFMILALHIFGEINVWIGLVQTLLTLICLWPIIHYINRYIPKLVGKAELINYHKIKKMVFH